MYQREVDVDMLNAVESVLADVSSVSPLSEQRGLCVGEHLCYRTLKSNKRSPNYIETKGNFKTLLSDLT